MLLLVFRGVRSYLYCWWCSVVCVFVPVLLVFCGVRIRTRTAGGVLWCVCSYLYCWWCFVVCVFVLVLLVVFSGVRIYASAPFILRWSSVVHQMLKSSNCAIYSIRRNDLWTQLSRTHDFPCMPLPSGRHADHK